ncbi:MAG: chloride channel protein [Dehalococcoidia bacterium]|nr:chloride channel protein [Dehalococcoidia bacterium]
MDIVSAVRRRSGAQSQRLAPLLYASVGGLAAGVGTVALVKGLEYGHRAFFDGLGEMLPFGQWSLILIVALGGLLAGLIDRYLGHESRGHGVPDVMYAFEHAGGRMPWRVSLSGALATIATIGAGGSAGQEGPSVHIGAGLASLVGSGLRVGPEHRRLLVAVGAAGGISAVFNAPLTGSFFALEVVLRRFTIRNFSAVVLGAVLANVVYRGLLGDEAVLRSPAYSFDSGWEIITYAALGIGTALVALGFVRGLGLVETVREHLALPLVAPAIGGALVGLIGVWHSEIIGTGTEQIASYLNGETAARLLLLLVVLKVISTSLTLGSGGTGGVFMPSLFLGAAFGGAFGHAADRLVPGLSAAPGAYAVAGMAGVFAAAASAPITSLLLAFEVSRDYGLVVPLMVVVVISTAVGQLLMHETVYSEGLRKIGIDLSKERASDRLESISVGNACMPPAFVIPSGMLVDDVRAVFARLRADILPVSDGSKVVGMISARDLLSAGPDVAAHPQTAAHVMTRPAVTANEDETLQAAVLRMDEADVRALAVVGAGGELVGILERSHVLGAYASAAPPAPTDAATLRQIEQPGGHFLRARVYRGGPLSGLAIRDLHFPEGSLIVSIRRARQTLVPRPSMVLQPGDQLVILAEEDARVELDRRHLLNVTRETRVQRGFGALYQRFRRGPR